MEYRPLASENVVRTSEPCSLTVAPATGPRDEVTTPEITNEPNKACDDDPADSVEPRSAHPNANELNNPRAASRPTFEKPEQSPVPVPTSSIEDLFPVDIAAHGPTGFSPAALPNV
jgi:hypothetical protein